MQPAADYTAPPSRDAARAPLPWRIARMVATLGAAAVLAAVLAHWGWQWFGPEPAPLPPRAEAPESPAAIIAATPWFGNAPGAPASVASNASPRLAGDARLVGVIAGQHGSGYALFRFADRGPVLVATGHEIAPGVMLDAVTPGSVRVIDHGEGRDIVLRPAPGEAAKAAPAPAQRTLAAAANPACVPPGGATSPPYRLNAELLSGIAARPDTWSNAFTAAPDGLSLREGNAFGAMLGMRSGDRVSEANGVPLRGPDDVLVAVIRPLLANQAVKVSGMRDGKRVEWVLVNAALCT